MYNTPYQRGSLHIHERLLHNLVLGEEIYQISKLPKQASINALNYVLRCSFLGHRSRTVPPAYPQRVTSRRQKYGTKRRYARERGIFLPIGNRRKTKKERRADARRTQQAEGGRQKGERIARTKREDCEKVERGW